MVRLKCSEHNFHIASFSTEQIVINEEEDTIEAGLEEESEVLC